MGNPAGMARKKKEKRRAKFETRLGGPLAYIPKEDREKVLAEIEKQRAATAAKTTAK